MSNFKFGETKSVNNSEVIIYAYRKNPKSKALGVEYDNKIKVGETFRNEETRLLEQHEDIELIKSWKVKTKNKTKGIDKEIHKRMQGCIEHKIDGKEEWFSFPEEILYNNQKIKVSEKEQLEIIKSAIDSWENDTPPKFEVGLFIAELDSLQKKVINEVYTDLIENNSDRHLIHAETGSGKTLMTYKLLQLVYNNNNKKYKNNINVVITWKPNVLLEWKKYVDIISTYSHRDLTKEFIYVETKEEYEYALNTNKTIIIGISAYTLMRDKEYGKKFSWLYNLNLEFLICDEVHYGGWGKAFLTDIVGDNEEDESDAPHKFYAPFKFEKLLTLSATPFPNIQYSNYYNGHISTITAKEQYELKNKVINNKTNKEDERYRYFPNRQYWIKLIDEKAERSNRDNNKTDFNIQSLFLENKLLSFGKQTIRGLRQGTLDDKDILDDDKHLVFNGLEENDVVIIRSTRILASKNLKNLFESDSFFDDYYKVFVNEVEKDKLDEIIETHKKVLIFTCGRFMTGWDNVKPNKLIYFCEPHSPCSFKQDEGRLFRINKNDPNKCCNIIFVSPNLNLTLATIAESWCAIKPDNISKEEWVKENLKYSPITSYGNKYEEIDWNDLNNAFNEQFLKNCEKGILELPLFNNRDYFKQHNYFGLTIYKRNSLTIKKSTMIEKGAILKEKKYAVKNDQDVIYKENSKDKEYSDEEIEKLINVFSTKLLLILRVKYDKNKTAKNLIEENIDDIVELCHASKEDIEFMIDCPIFIWDNLNKYYNTGAILKMPLKYEGSFQTVPQEIISEFEKVNINNIDSLLIVGGGENLIKFGLTKCKDIKYLSFTKEEQYVLEYLYPEVSIIEYDTFINFQELVRGKLGTMINFDLIIGNPPYKGCDKITQKVFESCTGKMVMLLPPPEWIKKPDAKERYKDLIPFWSDHIKGKSSEFRLNFNTRMELDVGIYIFDRKCKKPKIHENWNIKIPEFSVNDQIEKYNGQEAFLTLRSIGNEKESPVSFGIYKGKPFKLFDSNQIYENDTPLDVQNRRRARAGKKPLIDESSLIGITCKDKNDIIKCKEYLLSQQYLFEKVHCSHKWQFKYIPGYK